MAMTDAPVASVEYETRQWIVWAVGISRATQVLPWVGVAAFSDWAAYYYNPPLVMGLYLAYWLWALLLFRVAIRRNGVSPTWVTADVVIAAGCVIAVGLACRPGAALAWQNWTVGPAMGAAIVAVVYGGWRFGAAAGLGLTGAFVVSAWPGLQIGSGLSALAGNVAFGFAFAVGAGLFAGRLTRAARQADQSAREASDARAAQTRLQERLRQYDLLHSNVLTTLTLIARGPDRLRADLRQRCERDAKYLRGIVHSVIDASPAGLNAALSDVIQNQAAHGLDIHYSTDGIPHDLPSEVVLAIKGATMEALNNVLKHAGVAEAWVAATGELPHGVLVTVTDHGRGFDASTTPYGVGLAHSMRATMAEVGGQVRVKSYPGEGTSVEIQWAR